MTVIDGATNATSTVAAGSNPEFVAVNPATNKIYVTNANSANVTVIEEQDVQASPPSTTIMPLPQDRALGAESLFTFEATSATGVPPRDVYYQLDTWTGPWQRAVSTGVPGRWQGQVAHPFPGTPILYAFAVDGQEATSVNTGQGSSPVIGNITAYLFQVQPGTTNITITGHTPAPSYVGQPVEVSFALSVEPPAGGTPTGVVTVTDGMASCTATLPASSCSLTLRVVGTRHLVATYSGDNSFLASVSPGVDHVVEGHSVYLPVICR